jgi:hypothetical protein
MIASIILLAAVTLERLGELWLARDVTRRRCLLVARSRSPPGAIR